MSLTTEIGLKFSRSCMLQQLPVLRMSYTLKTSVSAFGFGHNGLVRAALHSILRQNVYPTSSGSDGPRSCTLLSRATRSLHRNFRCLSTESPAYRVVSSSSGEDLLRRQEATEQGQMRRLIMYSKPGCCLCDGLKEKLHLAFMVGGEKNISDVELEVRDISTNEEWEKLYQYEIPVLAYLKADNSEEVIPRFSPRLTIEQLQKKLAAALGPRP